MDSVEVYKISVLLAGCVSVLTAIIMSTAGRSRFVDIVFTLREWFFASVFFATYLVWENRDNSQIAPASEVITFRNYFMFGLIIISLVTLFAIVASRVQSVKTWLACALQGEDSDTCRTERGKNDPPSDY